MTDTLTWAELKLRVSSLEGKVAQFQALVEATSDWIWEVNGQGVYTYANSKIKDLLGYAPEEILGKTPFDLMPGDEAERVGRLFKTIVASKKPFEQLENTNIHKDGRHIVLETSGVPVFDAAGKVCGYRGVDRDITTRRQAEGALRVSHERFLTVLDSIDATIFVAAMETREILFMNKNMIEVFGRDMTGERCWAGFRGATEPCRDCTNDRLLDENGTPAGAYVWQGKNPITGRWYVNHDRAIEWTDGRLVKLQIATDITDLRRMEQQLQQTHKMEAIGTLAGGIAHQFNNALSGITGTLDLLAMDFPGNESVVAYTRTMQKAAHRMTQLTAQLLAYARGGRQQAQRLSLSALVEETLPLVKHTIGAALHIETDLPEDIFSVNADLTQMQMVLSAVLTNAAEAAGNQGRIRVTCRNETITDAAAASFPGLKPGNYVSLNVADDSQGMDEETRQRIFEPFFTTKFQGRGLGMAAAYGIVKNHNGWISVESEPGKGTRVKIYLPAMEPPVRAGGLKRPAAQWVKGTGTILVIDDDETILLMCRTMLERMGYRVLSAGSGQAAVEAVRSFDGEIEFALLDILLPDMNGSTVYPLLKQARPDLKVIVFSGYSSDGPVQEILDAGAQGFIQKPFTMADLSEKLKKT